MSKAALETHVAILGAGPAGTGPLFAALKTNRAERLLSMGATWLERGEGVGAGNIGSYRIWSDTQSDVLLECIPSDALAPLHDLASSAERATVAQYAGGPLPLAVAGSFLARAGRSLRRFIAKSPRSAMLSGFSAERVNIEGDTFCVLGRVGGEERTVRARSLVMALGGESSLERARSAELPDGQAVRDLPLGRVVTTDELFRRGTENIISGLPRRGPLRVAILGGSHSAYATAVTLLSHLGPENVRIEVLCRRLPKLFYPTLEAAHAEGYTQATPRDVCPVTKRVFRLAGLRLQARNLVRGVWGLGDALPQPSVSIAHLADREPGYASRALAQSDLAVLALGYTPRTIPFFDRGEAVPLLAHTGPRKPLVDGRCAVLGANGAPLPRVFGLGLASGFVPHGAMGGEPSFDGQTNGLWLYQNDVGERVLEQVEATYR